MPTKKNTYIRRQLDILSTIGLFYLIIIAFFAVPLMGAFVVVLIKGVADFRYAILIGGLLLLILCVFYLIRFFKRMFHKIRQDSLAAGQAAREHKSRGEPVQIAVLNGLLTLTYGGHPYLPALPDHQKSGENRSLLPDKREEASQPPESGASLIFRLKELSEMRDQGIITENEFQIIKTRLIKDSDRSAS